MRDKLGAVEEKVGDLQRSKTETTTALLEQKDSIEQLQVDRAKQIPKATSYFWKSWRCWSS